jgi:hypothetical protein
MVEEVKLAGATDVIIKPTGINNTQCYFGEYYQ